MQPLVQRSTVFLSYSIRDLSIAERFAQSFERNNVPLCWNLDTIPVGAIWEDFIAELVSASICTIVLWSSKSIRSEWVLREAELRFGAGL